MIVVCNGMPRSASTWSYNVARALLQDSGTVHGGYQEDVARFLGEVPEQAVHTVLKCHDLDDVGRTLARTGAVKVIYTWRSVADAVASAMRMFEYGFEHALSRVAESLELYRFHRYNGQALMISYRDVMEQPLASVGRVARYLGVADARLDAIAADCGFDRTKALLGAGAPADMLLYPNHIQDGRSGYGATELTPQQMARVKLLMERYQLWE